MIENKNYTEIKQLIDNLISKCSDGKYVFRGVKKNYKWQNLLSSSLFRKHEKGQVWNKYFSPKQAEKEIVEKARRLFPSNTSNVEILTDLRHYGGKINFIDFTYDLYVALFFACNGEFEEDGQLVMLNTDHLNTLKELDYEKNKDEITLIEPIQTSASRNRVIAQKSIFIYSSLGHIPKDQYIVEKIEYGYKKGILRYLKKFHNISSDTIYNDLIGFINNEENYLSAQVEFYKGLALMKEAEVQTNTQKKKEKYEKAITAYNKSIKLKPDNAAPYNNRGNTKCKLGELGQPNKYKEAIPDYNKAIQLNSNFAEAYNDRGKAKFHLGQHKEAISDCDKAIELDPNYANAYIGRGTVKSIAGQYKGAIADLEKAIQLDPNLESKLRPLINELKNKNPPSK